MTDAELFDLSLSELKQLLREQDASLKPLIERAMDDALREADFVAKCITQWREQGGQTQFGDIGDPENVETLIAEILRAVSLSRMTPRAKPKRPGPSGFM